VGEREVRDKAAANARSRRYYARNFERVLAKRRRPCRKCGGQKPAGIRRQLCDNCEPQSRREYAASYYARHPEACAAAAKKWKKRNPLNRLLISARGRAKRKGLPFDITIDDLTLPEFCPVLGIRLSKNGARSGASPSIDRIQNELGYVRGNVLIISWRANSLKGNATAAELRALADFYSALEQKS